jgi:hypothetical protein
MASAFVSGSWVVTEDAVVSVVEALSGLRWAVVMAEADGGRHFVSVAEWEAASQRDSSLSHPDLAAQLGPCRARYEEFRGADYSLVASVGVVGLLFC